MLNSNSFGHLANIVSQSFIQECWMKLNLFSRDVLLQYKPGNSNSEGKRKTLRVSVGPSYRVQLNIQFDMLIIDSSLIFQHISMQYSGN